MKVLVTGAAGFIGMHLSRKLAARGDDVVGIDNFNDVVYSSEAKRNRERALASCANFKMVELDFRDRDGVAALFEAEQFDAVAHIGGLPSVRNAVKYPKLYIDVNYNGSQNLMEAALATNVGNFVFASTSSVYGNTTRIPFVEDDPCARPLQPYAAAKRGIELLGYTYHYLYDLNFTALRFFTVYGSYNRPDMMIHLLADSIVKRTQIPLYENGNMYRDWTHVSDTTDGILLALDKPLGYEIFNLGRGGATLLRDFIEMLEKLAGKKANLVNKPKPMADFMRNDADISKARALLGFDPQVSVEEGMKEFWEWYVADNSQ